MKFGILKSYKEIDPLVQSYANACVECGVEYEIIDLFAEDWIDRIISAKCDGILVREKANISEYKSMYDERLWTINKYLNIPIYPSWHELYLYENKRMYSYFFKTHGINTPETKVFYNKQQALTFCENSSYPLVFKTNGGSAGTGVTIAKNKRMAKRWINQIFGMLNPRLALGRIPWGKVGKKIPVPKIGMAQKHYVIIQEYIKVKTEWRIIKIGDTYAGYQRPLENGHGSCNAMIYGWPPLELLQLIKEISEKNDFSSLSLDVLVSEDNKYYVTEMQSLYGSWTPAQCKINDKSGRIVYKNNTFTFEDGESFFKYNANILRVKDFIKKLSNTTNCSI